MRQRLMDQDVRARIASEIRKDLEPGGYQHDSGGLDSVVISSVSTDTNRWTEGQEHD